MHEAAALLRFRLQLHRIIDKRSAEMCAGLGRSLSKRGCGIARLRRACAHIPYLDGIMTVRRFGKGRE
jgi:hypothetical protein